jgi:cytochrome bd ubiquinol oxidase subunit I
LVLVYAVVFGAGSWYALKIIGRGPVPGESSEPEAGGPGSVRQQMRPISAASDDSDTQHEPPHSHGTSPP